jgi:hypothetical protein
MMLSGRTPDTKAGADRGAKRLCPCVPVRTAAFGSVGHRLEASADCIAALILNFGQLVAEID